MSIFGQSQPGRIGPFKTRDAVKNEVVNQANVDFQSNIMAVRRPIENMLGMDGSFRQGALAEAGAGYPSKDNLFQFLRNRYPSDRGINMEDLDQTYAAGKRDYNNSLLSSYNVQRQKGMSERKLRNKVGAENPELLAYSIQEGLMEPKVDGLLDDFLVALGAGGAALGTSKLYGMSGKVNTPGNKTLKALQNNGFKFEKGKIVRMNRAEIQDKFAKKIIGKGTDKGMKPKQMNIKMQEKVKDILSKQKNLSGVGKQAIKEGGSKRVRNIATNMALKNVGKHFGAKAAIGIAGKALGGLFSWPVALGIGAAQVAPLVYRYFKDEE